jgi:prevent-host-death family protein
MNRVQIEAAGDIWSDLMDRVEAGEEFALVRRGAPVAYLVPKRPAKALRGDFVAGSEAFDLHSDEAAIAWE